MTIEETIISFEKIAEYNESVTKRFNGIGGKAVEKYCEECKQVAAEHRQLIDWLLELKDLRSEQNEEHIFIAELMKENEELQKHPAKHGNWIPVMMSEATGWDLSLTGGRDEVCEYQCSVCGDANIVDEFGKNFLPPFCPWCGANLKDFGSTDAEDVEDNEDE